MLTRENIGDFLGLLLHKLHSLFEDHRLDVFELLFVHGFHLVDLLSQDLLKLFIAYLWTLHRALEGARLAVMRDVRELAIVDFLPQRRHLGDLLVWGSLLLAQQTFGLV